MLFNSTVFIFLFLPITLLMFYLIGERGHHRVAISWLVAASLFFYGWWNPDYLMLILVSVLFNFALGQLCAGQKKKKFFLIFGITGNLLLLGYFKYANFFVDNINTLISRDFHLEHIVLPLAISFFTFQQITYLVDAYRGETREYNFLHYCLFVTFFPQLIAGPIVHHREMLPQFARNAIYRLKHEHLLVGLTIFVLGLFKKVVLADGVAGYATPVFDAAAQSITPTFFEAWAGVMAYTTQLYFDFSGYSDMAIGLARMFGIRLPLNFHSPYKAVNIIDFWRRWHITLSRFLRDYLYIPLGGNRKGRIRRYMNLIITMLLGGLWHGAGWTFVVWGLLHGAYLVINHAWHKVRMLLGQNIQESSWWGRGFSRTLTLMAVMISWVFFRADSFDAAWIMLHSMSGFNGISLPAGLEGQLAIPLTKYGIVFQGMFRHGLAEFTMGIPMIITLFIIALFAPNTQQFMCRFEPAFDIFRGEFQLSRWQWLNWRPNPVHGVLIGMIIFFITSAWFRAAPSEFLYFNF